MRLLVTALAAAAVIASSAAVTIKADFVLIEKRQHLLTTFRHGVVLHRYRVALGRGGLAAKIREGDRRTPEGRYTIDSRNAASAFHKSLHISYPSPADRARARAAHVNPGGAIMVHGLPNGQGWLGALHREVDWTDGCIAVTDAEIEALWDEVPNGTAVEIRK